MFISFITKTQWTYLTAFLCSLLHEIGHIIAAILLGYKFKEISILPIGINGKIKDFISNKSDIFIISIAGPLINLILALITCRYKNQALCLSNIYMLLLNLLPIPPLDGWRISSCFFNNKIYEQISHLLAYTVVIITILFEYFNKNTINYLLIWIMFFSLSKLNYKCEISHRFLIVNSEDFIYKLLKEKESIFFVYENDKFLGTINYSEIFEKAIKGDYLKNTKDLLEERIKNGYQRT